MEKEFLEWLGNNTVSKMDIYNKFKTKGVNFYKNNKNLFSVVSNGKRDKISKKSSSDDDDNNDVEETVEKQKPPKSKNVIKTVHKIQCCKCNTGRPGK